MWDNELIIDKDQFSLKIKLKQYSENDQKHQVYFFLLFFNEVNKIKLPTVLFFPA